MFIFSRLIKMYLLIILSIILFIVCQIIDAHQHQFNQTVIHNRPKRQYFQTQGNFHCTQLYGGYGGYGNNICFTYYIVPGAMTWYGANTLCRQMGGTLFSPYTLDDVNFVHSLMQPYRSGTGSVNRSYWLGMVCQCQFGNPFGCFQCQWADGRPVSAQAFPPNSPNDQKIGPLWSTMYYRPDHFARSFNGQMCLFMTDHWALNECTFMDLQGGAICQMPSYYGGAGYGAGGFGKKK